MIANKTVHVTVVLLVYFCDQFVASKIVTADVTAVFVNNQHDIQQQGQDFDKEYTAKRLTKESPEKSWTKHGVNKLLKKLQDIGTTDRRPGSGRPRSEKKIAMPSYA